MNNYRIGIALCCLLLGLASSLLGQDSAEAASLKVCATVPELGSLVRTIAGDRAKVTVLAKGNEDVHYLDAKPSFIKALSEADLFVQVGMELEAGWAPFLLQNARNARIQQGAEGYLDASTVVAPLEVPAGVVDRSMGDIHPQGNPHYLTDPLNGLQVAELIRDRLTALDPAGGSIYRDNFTAMRCRMGELMIGRELAAKYDFEKIALLYQYGKLADFLHQQGDGQLLGGWFGLLSPHSGAPIVTYHKSWPYFARRFRLTVVGQLEPRPGIPPSPRHLKEVIDKGRAVGVKIVLQEPWQPRKPAALVAGKIGVRLVRTAVSSAGNDLGYDYLAGIDGAVRAIVHGLNGN